MLGNLSILNNEYVCTVPLELNQGLNELMSVAEKVNAMLSQYGFISAKLLQKVKNWDPADFELRIRPLRKQGLVWVDKKTNTNPHYYFASHINDFDVRNFVEFINQF